jgi:hypothetical protein
MPECPLEGFLFGLGVFTTYYADIADLVYIKLPLTLD